MLPYRYDYLWSTAFRNPDGYIVVVVQNEGNDIDLSLVIDGKGVDLTLPANSITTYMFKN